MELHPKQQEGNDLAYIVSTGSDRKRKSTWYQICALRACARVCVLPPREQVWNEFGERMKIYAKQKRKWREESVRR